MLVEEEYDELKQELTNRIKEGKDIPESFKNLLFPKKELLTRVGK